MLRNANFRKAESPVKTDAKQRFCIIKIGSNEISKVHFSGSTLSDKFAMQAASLSQLYLAKTDYFGRLLKSRAHGACLGQITILPSLNLLNTHEKVPPVNRSDDPVQCTRCSVQQTFNLCTIAAQRRSSPTALSPV